MKEKKRPTEHCDVWQEEQVYQTGSVTPPKKHSGLIAFLLVLVIFLSGISTGLGLMNIHLFRQLSASVTEDETGAVVFSDSQALESSPTNADLVPFSLGFTGQGVPDFWRHYYDLPQGIYITEVEPSGAACNGGLLPGDVLISLEGILVPNTQQLTATLELYESGDPLSARVFRAGTELNLTIIMD